MTPSILTAAKEGLRLAEENKNTADSVAFFALLQHSSQYHADICRALIQLQAENSELKCQLEEAVDERPLCETAHILLKANHTYRFIVAEGCADCARMAHEAATGPEELAAIDAARAAIQEDRK